MLLSAVTYNLKKLLRYTKKRDMALANALKRPILKIFPGKSLLLCLNLTQRQN
jgi:hypothetical protein